MTAHDQLVHLLATRSAKRGDFLLASGRRSSLYIDCRLTTMSPEGQLLIGREGLAAVRATGWGGGCQEQAAAVSGRAGSGANNAGKAKSGRSFCRTLQLHSPSAPFGMAHREQALSRNPAQLRSDLK